MKDGKTKTAFRLLAVAAFALSAKVVLAGGLVDLDGGTFDGTSSSITNRWFPLPPGALMAFAADDGEECVLDVVTVVGPAADVGADDIDAIEVLDIEYIDVDCNQLPSVGDIMLESTFDWYAQDVDGNVWYLGEDTAAFNWEWDEEAEVYVQSEWSEEDCDFIDDGDPDVCLDGSWVDGEDVLGVGEGDAERGIIMLAEPERGDFYAQETYPDVAEDMGKVINFKRLDGPVVGEQEDCLVIKEWNPLEPGSVEHKYYCLDIGLSLVEENAGGKTLWVDLIFSSLLPL